MTLPQILDLASKIGMPGVLILILYSGYKGIWRWGSDYTKLEKDRDEWKRVAMTGINAADAVTDYAIRQRLAHDAALEVANRRQRVAEQVNDPPPPHQGRRKTRP